MRARTRLLDGVSFDDLRDAQINGGSEPVRAFSARVDGSFLTLLGIQPALGRLFVESDNIPGRDRVVILTDGFWHRNFGADASIISRSIVVNGAPYVVIGVLPPQFHFDYLSAEPIELYVPFTLSTAYTSRGAEFANVRRVFGIGRLKPQVSVAQASSELQSISESIASEHPALYRRGSDGRNLGYVMQAEPLGSALAAGRSVLLLLFGAVGLVLLIACVNTAQFLLARAIERRQEVAVRSALGAGRARLVCQFLSEALLLAALADRARLVGGIGVDYTVVAFTALVALTTTVTFGFLPALQFSRVRTLNDLTTRAGGGRRRMRHAMVAVEVAISVLLLVSAGVVVRALIDLQRAPSGYSVDNVTVMRIRARPRSSGGAATGNLYQQYLDRVAAVPGVAAVAFADAPLSGFPGVEFSVIGRSDDAATLSQQRASWRIVSPDYFAVLGIPIRAGRSFARDDTADRPRVAIVNEEFARRFWPDQSPLGQQIRSGVGPRNAVTTIVGVVRDVRPPLQTGMVPQIYVSYLQQSEPSITLLVRSAAGTTVSPQAIKQAVWSVAPDQPLFDIRPMSAVIAQPFAQPRMIAQFLGSFAMLALLMSTLGVYMIVTYLTSRRAKEIALRRAIGAASLDIFRLLAGQTLGWTIAGLILGIAGAVAASGALRAILASLTALDPGTVSAIAALYLIVVAIADCVPALKAMRSDPATVLRAE